MNTRLRFDTSWRPWLAAGACLLAACGKQGAPLPPLRITPQPPTELRVVQRGARLELSARAPRVSIDGLQLPVLDLEFAWSTPAARAKTPPARLAVRAAPGEVVQAAIDPIPTPGTMLSVVARAKVERRISRPSASVRVEVRPAPPAPRDLTLERTRSGVALHWTAAAPAPETAAAPATVPTPETAATPPPVPAPQTAAAPAVLPTPAVAAATPTPAAPALRYSVYRRTESGAFGPPLSAEPTDKTEWTDSAAEAEGAVCYVVRTVLLVSPPAESETTAEQCLTASDRRPPAQPGNLVGAVAAGRVQLSWRASPDRRIAGYRVYRTRADGAPVRLADLTAAARSYSDAARPKGEQPEYAVTAVDRDGRESLPARVTIAQPQSAEPGATP